VLNVEQSKRALAVLEKLNSSTIIDLTPEKLLPGGNLARLNQRDRQATLDDDTLKFIQTLCKQPGGHEFLTVMTKDGRNDSLNVLAQQIDFDGIEPLRINAEITFEENVKSLKAQIAKRKEPSLEAPEAYLNQLTDLEKN